MKRELSAALLATLLTTAACAPGGDEQVGQDPATESHHEAGISWFEGDVEGAFAAAREEDKPLFLYWGAIWCPPCHYLKNNIFKEPAFVAKMDEFIPVYLDGDTERAQIWGEKLGAMGYPTVMIFAPDGTEVMRMPADVPVTRYAEILDAAVTRYRPVTEVLAEVLEAGPAHAARQDLELLAFYSWGQAHDLDLEDQEKLEAFRRLYYEAPEELADTRSRFLALALSEGVALSRQEGDDPDWSLAPEDREAYRQGLLTMLESPELALLNKFFVTYWSREVVELLEPDAGAGRDELVLAWKSAARLFEDDESSGVADRLSAFYPQVELARLQAGDDEDVELPPELVDRLRQQVQWAADTVTDGGELQTVMNTMVGLLTDAGLEDEAQALLDERMDDAEAPYYFMSYMAHLAKDDPQKALQWYRKAYDGAEGHYTRFRWGATYLVNLLEMDPENDQLIETEATEILGEVLGYDDAFSGGIQSRFERISKELLAWNESGEHDEVVERLRQLVHNRCGDFDDAGEDSSRGRCLGFLVEESE